MSCQRGNDHFDVNFWRIRSVHFPSKEGKDASYEWRNEWKGVYFPSESAYQPLMFSFMKTFFPIFTLTWRVNNYVSPPQGKGICIWNGSTKGRTLRNWVLTILTTHFAFSLWETFQLLTSSSKKVIQFSPLLVNFP